MSLDEIIAQIDEEIRRLQLARSVLAASDVSEAPAQPRKPKRKKRTKHNITPEGRARIAAAVKRRWAAQKKAAK